MDRFTISLEQSLADEFDRWLRDRGYASRSEAVRDLIREELEQARQVRGDAAHCVACLSYVYNHHERDLARRLTETQHAHHDLSVATMHAHLDHEHCIETQLLQGPTAAVRRYADAVVAERGVRHGKLNLISAQPHGMHRHQHGEAAHRHLKPTT
ncbi:MAG: nickel-responsive transcriptional regulator NikR [Lautropia sp.]